MAKGKPAERSAIEQAEDDQARVAAAVEPPKAPVVEPRQDPQQAAMDEAVAKLNRGETDEGEP